MKVFNCSAPTSGRHGATTRTSVVIALVAMTAVALPASAAMDSGAPSVTVRFNDLNLSTEAGTQVLLHRLKYAARQVCGEVNPRELTRYTQIQACYRQAIGTAVNSIHNEHLTALYGTPKGSGAT